MDPVECRYRSGTIFKNRKKFYGPFYNIWLIIQNENCLQVISNPSLTQNFGRDPGQSRSLPNPWLMRISIISLKIFIFTYLLLYLKNLFLLIESLWLFWFYCTKTLWLIVNCPSLPVPPHRLESIFWPQFDLDLISRISYLSLFEGHF